MKQFLKHSWQPILLGITLGSANITFYGSWQFWAILMLWVFKIEK